MKIGILEAGDIIPGASPHAEYGPMFHEFLTSVDPEIETQAWAIYKGVFPDSPQDADGWLISGSKHGVYDPLDWIAPAEQFVRDCMDADVPVVGICFGHQLIAKAVGAKVQKSDKGWGTGVNSYRVDERPNWMSAADSETSVRALHQDQVLSQPPGSTVFASSEFCEFAGLYYGDKDRPKAISLQPHPEFTADYTRNILTARRGTAIPEEACDSGIASLGTPVDNELWARAIVTYLSTARAA